MLRKIRILLAVIFFVGITLLFLDFSGTVQPWLGWMAKLQFLPSVMALNIIALAVVLALTLAVGRLYCSVICPLGVMQDVFAWIGKLPLFRKNKKTKTANKYTYSKPKTWLRFSVLGAMVVMILAGFNAGFMLIAPYSAYGRIVSSALQPIYIGINNLLATWAESNDSWIRKLLSEADTDNMKLLARETLKTALKQYGASDDMTVLAVRIEKRE